MAFVLFNLDIYHHSFLFPCDFYQTARSLSSLSLSLCQQRDAAAMLVIRIFFSLSQDVRCVRLHLDHELAHNLEHVQKYWHIGQSGIKSESFQLKADSVVRCACLFLFLMHRVLFSPSFFLLLFPGYFLLGFFLSHLCSVQIGVDDM